MQKFSESAQDQRGGHPVGSLKKRQNRKPQSAGLYMFNICISVQLSVPFVCLSFDEDEST